VKGRGLLDLGPPCPVPGPLAPAPGPLAPAERAASLEASAASLTAWRADFTLWARGGEFRLREAAVRGGEVGEVNALLCLHIA